MTGTAEQRGTADHPTPAGRGVIAWSLWDGGSAAFNAVVTTFVFTVYLTGSSFGDKDVISAQLGWALAIAGLLVALLAPITGQRSDASGRRKLWLGVNTFIVVGLTAAMFFVQASPDFLLLGLILLAAGTVFYEFATVNYNAMLGQVSTPKTIGRVSGFGWSMGYFGGIVLLLILYFGFIHPDVGLFGVTDANGLSVRVSMLIAAAWFGLFSLPLLFRVPEYAAPTAARRERVGFFRSYVLLGRDVAALWRGDRQLALFLIASAVFRDGLTGVFQFGGILAAGTFGFSSGDVIIFAIVANVIAGISTVLVGRLDDRLGAKNVMVVALSGTIVAGLAVFFFATGGATMFWIFGLLMCVFVGPAQSASRSFLARGIPAGREGEIFGLYATTGKAATFLAPTLFALFVSVSGSQVWGILGIALVLLVGLLMLIPVKAKQHPLG
ncbi:MFS transporter [Cryobacterium sp. MDB1-18-2]|uniref:MFS transporter n=1 Tax=unclassified Cryobacterium TaxID=2649013 RepID=UPI00106C9439|nr:MULTISPECIES: MFS transporter [unclassified Cryobacterium]MDY7529759.1 MFS transporter [Cryobacterium sp. 10C2]MEB0202824.1 MFS transporter [Cryobacterium sp. 5I3]MEB0289479.1 MFS transporter [Cryobacterium sp. 10C2]TFC35293.1 MFS transporter [Cryobacterium sp. MDB1-18-2]TFC45073.1 MFS transporter [Cryobacterium sp. MDB1-18-1]